MIRALPWVGAGFALGWLGALGYGKTVARSAFPSDDDPALDAPWITAWSQPAQTSARD